MNERKNAPMISVFFSLQFYSNVLVYYCQNRSNKSFFRVFRYLIVLIDRVQDFWENG